MSNFKALRALAPHIATHRGKLFVVKIGGEVLADTHSADTLAGQLAVLDQLGIRLVIVHGAGPQLSAACAAVGIEPQQIDGRRVTTPEVLRIAQGVFQDVQLGIATRLNSVGVSAYVSNLAEGLIRARRRGPVKTGSGELVDYGEVGDIAAIDKELLSEVLASNAIPLIAPLGLSESGALLNINADTVAAELATFAQAAKLIFVTQMPGILRDATRPGSVLSELTLSELEALRESGVLSGGMLPKAAAAVSALSGGVPRVHFVSGLAHDALLAELFTNEGSGTLVVPDA